MKVSAELGAEVHRRWMAAMQDGDFTEAWRQTDRLEIPRREQERRGPFTWSPEFLLWNGTPFDGRDVLVRCNHGLGDTLQFIRFVPRLTTIARRVTVMAQPPLIDLLRHAGCFGDVRDGWHDAAPACDVEIEVMELAYAFRATTGTLPPAPYLPVPPHPPLLHTKAHRVGLLWTASEWDPSRSLPLAMLAPLARIPDVALFSLQQGPAADEPCPFQLHRLSPHTREITAAASALRELDLFITVDSMAAHLAGAIGTPVWLLLRRDADWRWMRDRTDSPWYPTMRNYRQRTDGWSQVIGEVAAALTRMTSTAAQSASAPAPSGCRASP